MSDGERVFAGTIEMPVSAENGSILTYECHHKLREAGEYAYSFRMYPKNDALPHRQDFAYTRWF